MSKKFTKLQLLTWVETTDRDLGRYNGTINDIFEEFVECLVPVIPKLNSSEFAAMMTVASMLYQRALDEREARVTSYEILERARRKPNDSD